MFVFEKFFIKFQFFKFFKFDLRYLFVIYNFNKQRVDVFCKNKKQFNDYCRKHVKAKLYCFCFQHKNSRLISKFDYCILKILNTRCVIRKL